MNCGRYLEEDLLDAKPTKFCIGVSGYPEKHFEAPNIKVEVDHVKQKISSGGDYVVTQMFYDNKVYFDFVNRCREAGIEAPIIPGLKVLTAKSHLFNIPKNFYINIPEELSGEILEAKDEHVMGPKTNM